MPTGSKGSYQGFFDHVHADDRARVVAAWQAAIDTQGPFDIEHRIMVGDEIRWIRQIADLECEANGKPFRGVGIVQDITERKQV